MHVLPIESMKLHVMASGMVLIAAHEHNGSLWWTKLPSPPDDHICRRDLESVGVDLIDGRVII